VSSQGFVASPFDPKRRATRVVCVGDVAIGGDNPIRIQSMTTTDTLDTNGTVAQTVQLAEAGCEIVRITAPSLKDAENLANIKAELLRRGVEVPLVADIHFTPNAAMVAAEHVEKIRVNPGNYADKKKFEVREYSDESYAQEVERVAERFRPLVRRCRELGRAMRIGTNHGSLADRIMNRFGDTPRGMVESALEFLDVCEDENYYDVIFSMKSSNAQVAIQAYRMLAARLAERAGGLDVASYPFHVGVTEAGDAEDGRVKSAIGIGSLLEDGIGDTIRVSLTEHPVKEVPVARALALRCEARWAAARSGGTTPGAPFVDDPFAHRRRSTRSLDTDLPLGGAAPVRVELDLGALPQEPESAAGELCEALSSARDIACEGLTLEVYDPADRDTLDRFRRALREAGLAVPIALRAETRIALAFLDDCDRLVVPAGALIEDDHLGDTARAAAERHLAVEWELRGERSDVVPLVDRVLEASGANGLEALLISTDTLQPVHAARLVAARLRERGAADVPIVLRYRRGSEDDEAALLGAAIDLGAPLCDGIGDAVVLAGFSAPERALDLGYRVLQGARLRTSWTEFISCPSCGRTLFDLEETTARIKSRTGHLKGVKIAIMGCIVNGPGEMADADFGYVGSGPGTVNLFVGQECIERHVPEASADARLVELIRRHGAWIDPTP
jgi:(E)-4-hydroxy-3-methylbut-2-enyl-diphosphate synthase